MATRKEELQEQALELEIEIRPGGNEMTIAQLEAAIADASATDIDEVKLTDAEQAELTKLQEQALTIGVPIYTSSEDDAEEYTANELKVAIILKEAVLEAESAAEEAEKEEARESARMAESMVNEVQDKRDAEAAKRAGPPIDLDAKLDKPVASDRSLAAKHSYPVVIPGAKAYRTRISFNCAYGGGLRLANSVVLLTDAHAKNKLEYLTEVV